ncbi:hypothetical protein AV530_000688 [Patagioenas fasciata monilis]|uniref:Sushi domain-containing protein n=1 Tax=Patagioenas fasciata monilis TaxID=372326 RepID=A0A1V4IGA5_PATFA|nr:hypothetical protein AV530_000688 [Patagioenas fasciata monilis]
MSSVSARPSPAPRPSKQSCLSRQQLLAAIRQMQQLLKGQETRFAEGLRVMRSRLSTLHNSLAKAAPEPPPVSCPALQAPADGKKFGTKHLVEHEVHFACEPGFQLLGSSTRTCQPDGSWSGQEPRCAEITVDWGHLPVPGTDGSPGVERDGRPCLQPPAPLRPDRPDPAVQLRPRLPHERHGRQRALPG